MLKVQDKLLQQSYDILDSLRLHNGMYLASPSDDYSYVWIRDSVYMSLPYLDKKCNTYEKTYWGILDIFRRYEWKIDIHTRQKPVHLHEYIHSRYTRDGEEIHEPWGHNQLDAIGAFLWGIGTGLRKGKQVLRDNRDTNIIRKLIKYLECVEYWHTPDNGMWEENLEVHSSSIGACVAGLRALPMSFEVPIWLIDEGEQALMNLLPRESITKDCDLAQLSLIYPYNIVPEAMQKKIFSNVTLFLARNRGVIRYKGDSYYSTLHDNRDKPVDAYAGHEAEWTFGFPWLALCARKLNYEVMCEYFMIKSEQVMLDNAELPELYYAGTDKPNPNTPLGWSSAMYILAKEKLNNVIL